MSIRGATAKRAMDLALTLAALPLALPLMAAIALWVRLDSPGPALFRQERLGRGGVPFRIHKFRTMHVHDGSGPQVTAAGDARITRAGRWLRATKLQSRAARTGFDWPDAVPVLDKLREEIDEVRAEFDAVAAAPGDADARDRLEDEIGDILFVCANLARHAKVDFGAALRRANHKFERRFRAMEALAEADGGLAGQSLEAQDRYWVRAKQAERTGERKGDA